MDRGAGHRANDAARAGPHAVDALHLQAGGRQPPVPRLPVHRTAGRHARRPGHPALRRSRRSGDRATTRATCWSPGRDASPRTSPTASRAIPGWGCRSSATCPRRESGHRRHAADPRERRGHRGDPPLPGRRRGGGVPAADGRAVPGADHRARGRRGQDGPHPGRSGRGDPARARYQEEFDGFLVRSLVHDGQREAGLVVEARARHRRRRRRARRCSARCCSARRSSIRLREGSPVLFRQTRVGLHGRPFTIYKFRTMVPDAEEQLDDGPAPQRAQRRGVQGHRTTRA